MKTINTCLPIYDKLAKQCYERAKGDLMAPTITPLHRLPSFQWLDDGDGAATVSKIELMDALGSYNVPLGFTGWANTSFDTFTSSGLNVTSAIVTGASDGGAGMTPVRWFGKAGETIRVKGTLVYISRGTATDCKITIYSSGGSVYNEDILEGAFEVTHTLAADSAGTGVEVALNSGWGPKNFRIDDFEVMIDRLNQWFPALPALATKDTRTWFVYSGDTLKHLLPEGLYYLKITMDTGDIYYSEWFLVDCVYENLITEWTNHGYETLTKSGTTILSAINTINDGYVDGEHFDIANGESILVIFYLTKISGTLPVVTLLDYPVTTSVSLPVVEGLNVITLTSTWSGTASVGLYNFGTNVNYYTSEVLVLRSYSEKYLTFNFEHSCDLGDINYDDFLQTLYLETEAMEPTFPYIEKGAENGYGLFVPSFQRQDKVYLIKTLLVAQYIVEVLHRMKLHDTVMIIDLVGDLFVVDEIDTEHTWQGDDKYYALATITVNLSEEIIVTGCCTAVNECT